ncbi:hypothetical protein MN210_17965 [Psychrobacter raelei]|uniref:DUF2269 family protein n=1 Tax=Psychrobacter raelei TaxID=2565531 RepID=A0AAU6PVZ4_9GAMM
MVNFYINNVFLITVIVMGAFLGIPVLGLIVLRKIGLSYDERADIRNKLVTLSGVLLVAGFILPLVLAILLAIFPSIVNGFKPFAIYVIGGLVLNLIYMNYKRFKLVKSEGMSTLSVEGKSEELKEKLAEYKFNMIINLVLIAYLAVLLDSSVFSL